MKLSISESTQNFKPVTTPTFRDLAQHILYYNYSTGIFKNNDRKTNNFISADAIALDFDGGLSLTEAKLRFGKYKHIIAPTRNHQKPKNGITCDRFRVIILLDKRITTPEDYSITMKTILARNTEADQVCKDPARMFYPSKSIYSFKDTGETVKALTYIKPKTEKIVSVLKKKGKLLPTTLDFLLFGAPQGGRNPGLYSASKDLQGQGYSVQETVQLMNEMVARIDTWYDTVLSDKDVTTIERAYSTANNDDIRVKDRPAFDFKPIGQLYDKELKVTWLVNELLIAGGISILAAQPKSGKSTLVRQLAKAVCQGEEFLGRKTVKGKVAYLALEEHPAMLQRQFKNIGVKNDDDIVLHVGPVYGQNATEDLIGFLKDYEAQLVVIDTLALFVGLDDINSYDKVNKAMEKVRRIARESNAHVMLIHHTNKGEHTTTRSIMGSQAFLGAVDTALIINAVYDKRFLQTVGRGLTNFNNCEIVFNKEKEYYSLGMEIDNEF